MIFDYLLSKVAPYNCLNCAEEGRLLCPECAEGLIPVPSRCYRCRRVTVNYQTCTSCRSISALFRASPATVYKDTARQLVWELKFNGAQAAAKEMAEMMAALIPGDQQILLVPVPTATSRMRRRGYDQATLLARALAASLRLPYAPCLRRLGQEEQVGATRQQRVTQLQTAYRCINSEILSGKQVMLVDDVITTGATLEAAAKVIKAAGASRINAVVFAQA